MKANFKTKKTDSKNLPTDDSNENTEVSEEEFEEYMSKMGAAGSFMVFRSNKKKDDELGIDEL
jgi:hypothetical protein